MRTKPSTPWKQECHPARFTMIEMVMVIAIIMVLLAMFIPSFAEAKRRAKFTRWKAFNRGLNNDQDCIINYNFQEGEGNILHNGCQGAAVDRYRQEFYNAYMQNASEWNSKSLDPDKVVSTGASASENHNFEWVPGGRWGRYKKALQFNGSDTVLITPCSPGSNYSPYNDFTISSWIKFDSCENGDTPFSKSLWGTVQDAAAQYDMYINGYAASTGTGAFDVDCFRICGTWNDSDVDFKKGQWTHIALTYRYIKEGDPTGGPKDKYAGDEVPTCEIMAYINGKPLGPYIETYGENPGTCAATDWGSCYDRNVPLVIGGAGGYRKYWNHGSWDSEDNSLLNTLYLIPYFTFNGRMDEFQLFQRALTKSEIYGIWDMGRE